MIGCGWNRKQERYPVCTLQSSTVFVSRCFDTQQPSRLPENVWMRQGIEELNFMQEVVPIGRLSVCLQDHYITAGNVYCLICSNVQTHALHSYC